MKKFRSIKYGSLKKNSPLGHTYRFVKDKDISAVYGGVFYQADEDWMLWMTTHTGQNLLKWTNPPEELVAVTHEENTVARRVVKIVETPGFVRQDILPDLRAGKTQDQIDAEVELALKAQERERLNSLPVEEPIVEASPEPSPLETEDIIPEVDTEEEPSLEEIIVTPEVIESKEEIIEPEHEPIPIEEALVEEEITDLEFFKAELAKNEDFGKFIIEMKQEFGVPEVEALCAEVGIEYEKPKANAIKMIVAKLGE